MDPASAVGLASAILTFVDFGVKLTRGTFEVYKSTTGSTVDNAHLTKITEDLHDVTTGLRADLSGGSKHEKAVEDIAAECRKLSDSLLQLLQELTIPGDITWQKSLKVKFKSMRKDKEIQEIDEKLASCRSQLLLRLNLILRDEQSAINVNLEKLQRTSHEFQAQNTNQLESLKHDLSQSVVQLQRHEEAKGPKEASDTTNRLVKDLQHLLENFSLGMARVPKENIILKNLFYPSMYDRQSAIKDAEAGTFNWMFEDDEKSVLDWKSDEPQSHIDSNDECYLTGLKVWEQSQWKAQARSAFRNWLESGDGVFHISGNAGSGKSTLTSFLWTHSRTKQLVLKWAGAKRLIFGNFFFWNSGDKMQSSLQGLYRSILFEVLKNCPELIPQLFPQEWHSLQKQDVVVENAFLSNTAIKRAFGILTCQEQLPQYRLCFFIDGLDEYEGDSKDHLQLAENLMRWTSNTEVKICASSRPHNEFIHVFSDSIDRRIHLHELTKYDIYLFVRRNIEADRNFHIIKRNYLRLVYKIVDMSEGVFLWAALVVRSLSEGLLRHDTFKALEERLERTPKDLNRLYQQLFESMDKEDQIKAMKMLLLAAHDPSNTILSAVIFSWIDDLDDPLFPPTDGTKPSTWTTPSQTVGRVQRQLAGVTKGLLHVVSADKEPIHTREYVVENDIDGVRYYDLRPLVQFLHRSVRDYVLNISTDDVSRAQCEKLITSETYVRLWIAEMTLLGGSFRQRQWDKAMRYRIEVLFQEELPHHLIDAVQHLFYNRDSCRDVRHYAMLKFAGVRLEHHDFEIFSGPDDYYLCSLCSFIHLAAYTSQRRYVERELGTDVDLGTLEDDLNLLLSAALGSNQDLVKFLLNYGYSVTSLVRIHYRLDSMGEGGEEDYVPMWMMFLALVVDSSLYSQPRTDEWEILELLLHELEPDASGCIFVICTDLDNHILETISLRQMIQDLNPPNKSTLIDLLDKQRSSWLSTAQDPSSSQYEPVLTSDEIDKCKARIERWYRYCLLGEAGSNIKTIACLCCEDFTLYRGWSVRVY